MISASPLVGAHPRARRVDAAMAHVALPHAVPRADTSQRQPLRSPTQHPVEVFEPVILVLTALGASFLLDTVIAGIFP